MTFQPGNKLWQLRSSCGPKPRYETPEALEAACVGYFEWCEANPFIEHKPVTAGGVASLVSVPKMRVFTLNGLCLYLGIDETTWRDWREARTDLSPVTSFAEKVIREQKFGGAAAGLLNANIIARDLGLADKSELTAAVQVETKRAADMSDDELANIATSGG